MAEVGLDSGPLLEADRLRSLGRSDREELWYGNDITAELLPARDSLQLAQLLEWVEPHVRVRADAERDPVLADAGDGEKAVAQIRLRERADADTRARLGEERELGVVGVRPVDDRRPRAQAAGLGEELDRP